MKIVEVIKKGGVIHCATKEESNRILELLDYMGKGWVKSPVYEKGSLNLLKQDYWDVFKENTVYNPFSSYSYSIGQVAYGYKDNYKHMMIVDSKIIDGCYVYTEEINIFVPLPYAPGRIFNEFDGTKHALLASATVLNKYVLDLSKSCQIKVGTDDFYTPKDKFTDKWMYPHTVIYEILLDGKMVLISDGNITYNKWQIHELVANGYLITIDAAKKMSEKGY